MRSDIVPGAIFPDYELSTTTANAEASELQNKNPMFSSSAAEASAPRTAAV